MEALGAVADPFPMTKIILHMRGPSPSYYEKVQCDRTDDPPRLLRIGEEIETEGGPAVVVDVCYEQGCVHAEIKLKDEGRITELPPQRWRNLP